MFTTTSTSQSNNLSSQNNSFSVLENAVTKLKEKLQIKLQLGQHTHQISEWLGNPGNNHNLHPHVLHAGFQAALVEAQLADQLFFLEQLNLYLVEVETYIQKTKNMKYLEGNEELISTYKEYQAAASNALTQSLDLLAGLWHNCLLDSGPFKLNFSDGSIIENSLLGQQQTAEAGKLKIEEIIKILAEQQVYKQRKALKFLGEHIAPKNQDMFMRNTQAVLAEASDILTRILPGVLSREGVQQASREAAAAKEVMEKWQASEAPRLWGLDQAALHAKIKDLAKKVINCGSFPHTTSQSSGPLLSPRLLSTILSPRRQQAKCLPEPIISLAQMLFKAHAPFTATEVKIYSQLRSAVLKLEGTAWEELKKAINEEGVISSVPSGLSFK